MEFEELHHRSVLAVKNLRNAEAELMDLFQRIDACKGFKKLGYSSLHVYATRGLGLSDESAFKLIRVERKSCEVPELKQAVASGEITLSNAVVIASVINYENKEEWLEAAANSSKRELEKKVAELNPEEPRPFKAKPQGNDWVRLEVSVTDRAYQLLQRSQELLAQKKGVFPALADVILAVVENYVEREDPVVKADRIAKRHKTVPGDSFVKHEVMRRDRAHCQFVMKDGETCGQRKWLHVHHVKPRSEGGADVPDNLVTLCAVHHRMVHEARGN